MSLRIEPQLLSTAEVAAKLGITPRRVTALITAGKLRATRVGHAWVIIPSDLTGIQDRAQGWPKGRSRKED